MRRYLLQSDSLTETDDPPSPLIQPDIDVGKLQKFHVITCPKNPAVFNEQIYEMGSNVSAAQSLSDDGFGEPTTQAQAASDIPPNATNFKPHEQKHQDPEVLVPPVAVTNQALEVALSTIHPALSENAELKAMGPIFGVDLEALYQRDGVYVPRVVQHCIAVAERVGRQTSKVYDAEANQDDIKYLKDRFDNNRPVQVNARALFDHRTVDPQKLNFCKGDQILLLEPRDGEWFLGRRQDANGLLPLGFVHFSVEDIAGIIGTCKTFFRDLPDSLVPKLHYESVITAAYLPQQLSTVIYELPLTNFELLKAMILVGPRVCFPRLLITMLILDAASTPDLCTAFR